VSSGCAELTQCEYHSHVFILADDKELVISSFPSWLPQTKSQIPFLYKSLCAPKSVCSQFFMRPIGSTAGHNPNTESILVRDFSYKFPGQKPVVLIEDDSGVFWQQGQPDFISEKLKPVPCVDD